MFSFIRPRFTKKIISGSIAALFVCVQLPLALFASPLVAAENSMEDVSSASRMVTLCHATNDAADPYTEVTVDAASAFNGHYNGNGTTNGHIDDIIPAFVYKGVSYPAQGANQARLTAHCIEPKTPIVVTPAIPAPVLQTESCDTANDGNSGTSCNTHLPTTDKRTCINGNVQQSLEINFPNSGQATIATNDGAPLCDAVTLYFSSYTMPSNYDGRGFFPVPGIANPSAYPQTIFSSTHVTLPAGYDGTKSLSIDMPNSCNNTQVDVYYAPEITNLGPTGHGTQNILSKIYGSARVCTPIVPTQGSVSNEAVVILCHASGSLNKPYVKTTVSAAVAATEHYQQHENDIIPAFAHNGNNYDAQNFNTINQTIYNNDCEVPTSSPVHATGASDHVGLGSGSGTAINPPTPISPVLSLLTTSVVAPAVTATQPARPSELVNTGSTMLLNISAGLFILGAATALAVVPSKRRYT